jgi:hypothetical protein
MGEKDEFRGGKQNQGSEGEEVVTRREVPTPPRDAEAVAPGFSAERFDAVIGGIHERLRRLTSRRVSTIVKAAGEVVGGDIEEEDEFEVGFEEGGEILMKNPQKIGLGEGEPDAIAAARVQRYFTSRLQSASRPPVPRRVEVEKVDSPWQRGERYDNPSIKLPDAIRNGGGVTKMSYLLGGKEEVSFYIGVARVRINRVSGGGKEWEFIFTYSDREGKTNIKLSLNGDVLLSEYKTWSGVPKMILPVEAMKLVDKICTERLKSER